MNKMKEVYENNPALGDPNSINKKLEQNAGKLNDLQSELRKYQVNGGNRVSLYSEHSWKLNCVHVLLNRNGRFKVERAEEKKRQHDPQIAN